MYLYPCLMHTPQFPRSKFKVTGLMRLTRFLWNCLMNFNNIWQQCLTEQGNGLSHVYPGSHAHGHEILLSIYVTIKAANEWISLVLMSASCFLYKNEIIIYFQSIIIQCPFVISIKLVQLFTVTNSFLSFFTVLCPLLQ